MRYNRLFVIAFLGLLAFAAPAWAIVPDQDYVQVQFLPPQLLPPPPAEGSKAWQNQIDNVLLAQRSLSAAELATIKDEQGVKIEMVASVLGPTFTRQQLPKTFALLDRVMHSTGRVVDADKKYWHTRRPYVADPRVKLYVDPINDSPSYPSGHTTASRVLAEVLGMLVPEKQAALRTRAEAIARHRVEAGAHYPVDLEGGRSLAMLIVGAMTASEYFQDDLAAARKELAGK